MALGALELVWEDRGACFPAVLLGLDGAQEPK